MDKSKEILNYFPNNLKMLFSVITDNEWESINEVVFINNSPILIQINGRRTYFSYAGFTNDISLAVKCSENDIKKLYELITRSSVYAFARFIKQGFLTLPYGHRVGITGDCIVENNQIISVNKINSLSFRLAHVKREASMLIFDEIYNNGIISNVIIISPPGCGKTTMLRSIASLTGRIQDDGYLPKCAVVDERYEIAACINGTPSLDVGMSTVIISGCSKSIAIPNLVRSMAPDVIFTDELYTLDDISAIKYAKASGSKIIATTHGADEINNEIYYFNIEHIFDKVIVLSSSNGPGTIEKIIAGDTYDL